ncbi:MAG: hypothetical protein MJ132_04940 [Clostridia bacterium]|nr:hypothetical protein [Clostridia bacterium]
MSSNPERTSATAFIKKYCPWLYENMQKLGKERAVDLSMLILLLLQFVLLFCRLVCFSVSGNTKELGRVRECFSVAECSGSSTLTVIGAVFLAIAIASCLYLNFKNFSDIRVPVLDGAERDYYLVPVVISASYGIAMLIVARKSFMKLYELTDELFAAAKAEGVKMHVGYSFGGWLYWIATASLLFLMLYKIYTIYFEKIKSEQPVEAA